MAEAALSEDRGVEEMNAALVILQLFVAMLVCIGIWNAFGHGQAFGWLGDWMENHAPEWVNKPLWMCPPCMASVHGTWIWFCVARGGIDMWFPFILALSGLNRIVSSFIK